MCHDDISKPVPARMTKLFPGWVPCFATAKPELGPWRNESMCFGNVPESWALAGKWLGWTVFQNRVLRCSFQEPLWWLGINSQEFFAGKREVAVFLSSAIGGTWPRGGCIPGSTLGLAGLS